VTIPPTDDRLDAAPQRLERAIRWVPYVLLAVATLIATMAGDLIEHRSAAYRLGTVGVAAVTAGWMLWWVTLHPAWARRRGLMAVYCAGLLVLIGVLVTRSPWFGLFALTGYLHSWELLAGNWRVAGVTATAALHITAVFGGRLPDPTVPAVTAFVLMVAVTAGLAVAFSRWARSPPSRTSSASRSSSSWPTPTPSSRPPWPRTPSSRPGCWPRHGRPGPRTSASGWPARSTTPWPRA
jgi:hypothetical protein